MRFFGGGPAGEAWAAGLKRRHDGLWPRFDADVLARTLDTATSRSYWPEWERISCPTLVIRAGHGELSTIAADEMRRRGRDVTVVDVEAAGHDVHLDEPKALLRALMPFVGTV